MPYSRTILTWLVAALTLCGGAALAAPEFPPLTGRVVDNANLLDAATERELIELLAQQERDSSNQVIVVTLESLQGYDIADYGYQLGRHWGIGQEGRDNGALLIVAPNEREVRIEVGYGLEGTLTDALSSNIIQTVILPKFRDGDMAGGTVAGARAILEVIDGSYEPLPQRSARGDGESRFGSFMTLFIILIIAGQMLGRMVRSQWLSASLLGGGALLIGWALLGSLALGIIMAVLIGIFHLFIGGGGPPGGGHRSVLGGPFYGGFGRGGGFGGGGFGGGGGSFGGGGSSGSW